MAAGGMNNGSGVPRIMAFVLFLVWAAIAAALALLVPPASPAWPALLLAGMLIQAGCIVGVQRSSNARLTAALAGLVQRLPRPDNENASAPFDHAEALRLGLDSHERRLLDCIHRLGSAESNEQPPPASERMTLLERALASLEAQLEELAAAVGVAQRSEPDGGSSASKQLERLASAIAGQHAMLGRFSGAHMIAAGGSSSLDETAPSLDRRLTLLRNRLVQTLASLTSPRPAAASDLDALSMALAAVVARQRDQLQRCRVLVDGRPQADVDLEMQAQSLEGALYDTRRTLRSLVEAIGTAPGVADAVPLTVLMQSGAAVQRLVARQLTYSMDSLGHASNATGDAAYDGEPQSAVRFGTPGAANLLAQSNSLAALAAEDRRTIEHCRLLVDSAASQEAGFGPARPAQALQASLEQIRAAAACSHATVGGALDEPEDTENRTSLSLRLAGIDEAHRYIASVTQESLGILGERRDDPVDGDGQLRLDVQAERLKRRSDKVRLAMRELEDLLVEERTKLKKEEDEKKVQMHIAHLISHDIEEQTKTLQSRVSKIANLWEIARDARELLRLGAPVGGGIAGAEYIPVAHLHSVIESTVQAHKEVWCAADITIVPLAQNVVDWEVYFNEGHFRAILAGLLKNATKHGTDVAIGLAIEQVGEGEARAVVSVANKVAAANVPALCDNINSQITEPKVSTKPDGNMQGGTFFLANAAALSMAATFRCVPGDKAVVVHFHKAEDGPQDGRLLLANAAPPNRTMAFRCIPGAKAIAVQLRTRARRPTLQ